MDGVRLRIDDASLSRFPGGPVIGRLHFDFAGHPFPDDRWDDFVVVILTWWLEAVRSNDRAMVLRFMDGPYFIRLDRRADGGVGVECVEDRDSETLRVSCEVRLADLRREIESAGRTVLSVCRAKGWLSKDTEALAAALEE
jgi:hypothetical protein